jgi:hypothetical protein
VDATNGATPDVANGFKVRNSHPNSRPRVAGEHNSPNQILEDESSRLKDSLKSCHNVLASYRAMLKDSGGDNSADEAAKGDSEVG